MFLCLGEDQNISQAHLLTSDAVLLSTPCRSTHKSIPDVERSQSTSVSTKSACISSLVKTQNVMEMQLERQTALMERMAESIASIASSLAVISEAVLNFKGSGGF